MVINYSRKSDFWKVSSTGDEDSTDRTLNSAGQIIEANSEDNLYRKYYFRNPCVPIDFDTIHEALQHCPRQRSEYTSLLSDETTYYSCVGTVVLMPGVYTERVDINGTPSSRQHGNHEVAIRAAFPTIGATIQSPGASAYDDSMVDDEPCISIFALEDLSRGIRVDLSYLRVGHSSRRGVSA